MRNRLSTLREIDVAAGPPGSAVLVAVSTSGASAAALDRGKALAGRLGVQLIALHVVPRYPWWHRLLPWTRGDADVDWNSRGESMRGWCARILGPAERATMFILRRGALVETILATASDVGAAFIVVGDDVGSRRWPRGRPVAAAVIARSPRPVIVARPPRPVIPATTAADAQYAPLRSAAAWWVAGGPRVTLVDGVACGNRERRARTAAALLARARDDGADLVAVA